MSPLSLTDKALRSTGIFASEIAAVCGLHPYQTPIVVYCRKRGIELETPDPDRESKMDLGHRLEGMIAALYQDRNLCRLRRCKSTLHKEHRWCGATPDRKVLHGQVEGIEIKLVGARMAHHWTRTTPPDYVIAQVQWQMFVFGWKVMDIAALIGGTDYHQYRIERDEKGWIEPMFTIAKQLWDEHILPGIPPPVDGSNQYREFLRRRYPHDTGPMVRLRDQEAVDAATLASEYARAGAEMKRLGGVQDEASNKLRDIVGAASGVFAEGWKITWKSNKNGDRTLRITEAKPNEGKEAA